MNRRALAAVVAVLALVGAASYFAYRFGMQRGMQNAPAAPAPSTTVDGDRIDPKTGRRVLYWHDPMVPAQKFDKPGRSPFMDMDLVPVYADSAGGDDAAVSIDPRVAQNLGVRTGEATKGRLVSRIQVVGNVAFNERELILVQARVGGFVEKLYVRAPLDRVRKGEPLVEILAPEWVAVQEEYLSLKRMMSPDPELLAAARQRMSLLGMNEDLIRSVDGTGAIEKRAKLYAPADGIVVELGAREGMTVTAGATLFRINSLGTLWLNAEVPGTEAPGLRPGQPVQARSSAHPGKIFKGRINALLPQVNQTTRTVVARIELANPGGQLIPGMFVTVDLSSPSTKDVVLVPSEAVIRTGERSLVIVAEGEGKFRQRDVEVGFESGGKSEIRKGLSEGDKVVVSGQFLIDSEASLRATGVRMEGAGAPRAAKTHQATGEVVFLGEREFIIKHGDIPSAGMGAMTMPFDAPVGIAPPGLKKGDRIRFEFTMQSDGQMQITSIAPVDASVPDRGARK